MNIPRLSSRQRRYKGGFTLIEILVVIGMLAILSTAVLVAVNPLRQFAQARNTERENDVEALLNAVSERVADNGGQWLNTIDSGFCTEDLPNQLTDIGDGTNEFDLRSCLVSTYLTELPKDPEFGANNCTTNFCNGVGENYDLDYLVSEDHNSRRITVCAPGAAENALPGSKEFCLTR